VTQTVARSFIATALQLRPAFVICKLAATGLLGGAFAMEYFADLAPCPLCLSQRWPHAAVILVGGIGFAAPMPVMARRILLALCALAFAITAGIGFYHAGVEYGLLQGPNTCTGLATGNTLEELRRNLMNAPVVRCDEAPWSLLGISLAGYNFLASGALAVFAAVIAFRGEKN
jgi:disulfide bond formation protein DsbB